MNKLLVSLRHGLIGAAIMLAMSFSAAAAAVQMQDVVYLKNGSIVRGQIVELVPDGTVKIETADGSVFVFRMEEVERIAKEPQKGQHVSKPEAGSDPKPAKSKKESGKAHKYYMGVEYGWMLLPTNSYLPSPSPLPDGESISKGLGFSWRYFFESGPTLGFSVNDFTYQKYMDIRFGDDTRDRLSYGLASSATISIGYRFALGDSTQGIMAGIYPGIIFADAYFNAKEFDAGGFLNRSTTDSKRKRSLSLGGELDVPLGDLPFRIYVKAQKVWVSHDFQKDSLPFSVSLGPVNFSGGLLVGW